MNPSGLNRIEHNIFNTYGMMEKFADDTSEDSYEDAVENILVKSFAQDEMDETEIKKEVFCDKFYNYKGLHSLKTVDIEFDHSTSQMIHICSFHVNTRGKYPFLQFIMHKLRNDELNEDKFTFPNFLNKEHIDPLTRAENVLELMLYFYEKNGYATYKGLLHDDKKENYYLFFDCSNYEIDVHNLSRNNEMWLLSIDELVNSREVCGNFLVDQSVSNFFHEHSDFIYLQNSENINYEIPAIAYVGVTAAKSNYTCTFGMWKSDEKSMFGPNYYFYDYKTAAKMALEQNDKSKSQNNAPITIMNWLHTTEVRGYSVIRVALFLGKTKVIANSPRDACDSSQTTHDMLKNDSTCATLGHRELINYLRITDRDGEWTKEYDSVFLGEGVEIEDETVLNHSNTYVVKEYDQQLTLSCHFLVSKEDEHYLMR